MNGDEAGLAVTLMPICYLPFAPSLAALMWREEKQPGAFPKRVIKAFISAWRAPLTPEQGV